MNTTLSNNSYIITLVIKEKASNKIEYYEDVEVSESIWDTVDQCFKSLINRLLQECKPGEDRKYLIFYKGEGGRPNCSEASFSNTELLWEKSITGGWGNGFKGSEPYQYGIETFIRCKKGTFPAPPGSISPVLEDDGGIDEDAVLQAMRATHKRIEDAIDGEFDPVSRQLLLNSLVELIHSTGTTADMPVTVYPYKEPIEGPAILLYDIGLSLMLEIASGIYVPNELKENHLERLEGDPQYVEDIQRGIAIYRKCGS